MSFNTHKTWLYKLEGRNIHLYQYVDGVATDTLASYKIALPDEYYGTQLIYPNEDITNGLRVEYTALIEPFVDEAWESLTGRTGQNDAAVDANTGIAFVDGGGGSDTITDTGSSFVKAGFESGDKIRIIGSASNDGDYLLTAVSAGTLTVATDSLTAEDTGESVTIFQIPAEDATPDESNHVNLNRLLSLSVVDYLKAQLADMQGNVQMKEYYMREFWKKVGDNESNKRKISMTFPTAPFAVR